MISVPRSICNCSLKILNSEHGSQVLARKLSSMADTEHNKTSIVRIPTGLGTPKAWIVRKHLQDGCRMARCRQESVLQFVSQAELSRQISADHRSCSPGQHV